MTPNIDYIVNHEIRLATYRIKGKLMMHDYIDFVKSNLSSSDYYDKYNVIVDLRNSEIPDFLERIDDFVEFVGELSPSINMRRKCAYLTELPKDNAFTVYLIRKLETLKTGMHFKAFATESLALDWLAIS